MADATIETAARAQLPSTGRATWALGHVSVERVGGEQTGGAYALLDSLAPQGNGPPLHVHSREDEVFYVLDGELTVTREGRDRRVGAGGCVFLPRGVPHTYRVESPTVRALTLISPAGFEEFFFEFGEPAVHRGLPPAGDPPDLPRLLAVLERYGVSLA